MIFLIPIRYTYNYATHSPHNRGKIDKTLVVTMPRKDDRLTVAPIGEWYEDYLNADATINGRSLAVQASSLLCAKIQEREERIRKRVEYLARKRGIPYDECWKLCVTGKLTQVTPEEWSEMESQNLDSPNSGM